MNNKTGEFLRHAHGVTRIHGQTYDPETDSSIVQEWLASESPSSSEEHFHIEREPSIVEGFTLAEWMCVLQYTRDILIEDGLAAVTLERIIEVAQLQEEQEESLRSTFDNGQDLCARLLEQVFQPLFKYLSSLAVSPAPLSESLAEVGTRWIRDLRQDTPLYALCLELWRNTPPELTSPRLRNVLKTLQQKPVSIFAALLAEGQMRGEVRAGDPMVMAHVVASCLLGLFWSMHQPKRLTEAGIYTDDVFAETIAFLVRGLSV